MAPRPRTPLFMRGLRLGFQATRLLSPDLALRMAEHLFCLPRRHRTPEVEVTVGRKARTFSFRSQGLLLQGRLWGEGPPVALLHGWEGRGTQFHAFLEPLLAAGYSAVTFDEPAHGASEGRFAGPVAWSQAIGAFAREVGPLHGAVAHSLGAPALAIALDQGLLDLPHAVFLAPPAEPDAYYGGLLSLLGLPERDHAQAFEAFGARIGIPWDRIRLRSLAPGRSTALLVIHDRQDRDVPWESGATIASAWPGARLLLTEGLGHRRILRDPQVIAQAVTFLGRAPTSAALPFHGEGPRSLEWHLFHRELRTA